MSTVAIDLQLGWLRRHEVRVPQGVVHPIARASGMGHARCFALKVGMDTFTVAVRHLPESATECFTMPAEDERAPTDAEILLAITRAFLGSLPIHPEPEPDLEKGWTEFRRQALETSPGRYCPPWETLGGELREAFAAGVREAMNPSPAAAAEPQPVPPVSAAWNCFLQGLHPDWIFEPDGSGVTVAGKFYPLVTAPPSFVPEPPGFGTVTSTFEFGKEIRREVKNDEAPELARFKCPRCGSVSRYLADGTRLIGCEHFGSQGGGE